MISRSTKGNTLPALVPRLPHSSRPFCVLSYKTQPYHACCSFVTLYEAHSLSSENLVHSTHPEDDAVLQEDVRDTRRGVYQAFHWYATTC